MQAYAISIDTNYKVADTKSFDPIGTMLGLAFYVLQGVGIILALMGVSGIVTSRMDGDSSQIMNQAGKLMGGVILFALPPVLTAAGLIQ